MIVIDRFFAREEKQGVLEPRAPLGRLGWLGEGYSLNYLLSYKKIKGWGGKIISAL